MTAGQRALPTGTVTFLLTDIQGSTEAWQAAPGSMTSRVSLHYEILDRAIDANGGLRPEEQGEGDSVVAVFDDPVQAVGAAIDAQRQLREQLPDLPVRMALHTGEAMQRNENNYVGLTIIRCARIRNCGHGGQVLLSDETRRVVSGACPPDVGMLDLGVFGLRGLNGKSHIWQVTHPDLLTEFPPLNAGASTSIPSTYASLDPTEQHVVRRLSVFRAPFSLDGAHRVASRQGLTDAAVATSARKLIDQQLLEVAAGTDRYAMPVALQVFCRELLAESDDEYAAEHEHALWYADVADRPDKVTATDAFAEDEDAADLVAAVAWATQATELELAYRLIIGVGDRWATLSNPAVVHELATWLATRSPSDGERAWSRSVAFLSSALGTASHALHAFRDEALAIAELVGDESTQRIFGYRLGDDAATGTSVGGAMAPRP